MDSYIKMNYKCSCFCSYLKGQKFIESYLENVLEQNAFKDIEFVFLDCDSPENEKKFILPLTKQYENIKYYKLDKDPGLYAAWNHAVKLCSSDIIGNWNIDDRKNREGLKILLHQFDKDPELDVAYGLTYVSHIANEKYLDNAYNEIYPCLPHSFENLLRNNSPHCMPLWKKSLHDRFGYFDTNYLTAADGDFWLRCAVGGARIKMVNHPVGLYYENPTGRSTNPETLQQMIREVQSMRSQYFGYLGKIK
jgi:glycosyltransferase involved in cell wall biosynthesis